MTSSVRIKPSVSIGLWRANWKQTAPFVGVYWQLLFWKVFTGIGMGACFLTGARYIVGLFEGRYLHVAQGLFGGAVLSGAAAQRMVHSP